MTSPAAPAMEPPPVKLAESLASGLEHTAKVRHTGPSDRSFFVEARQGNIQRYPCRECHSQPLKKLKARINPRVQATHSGIVHPHSPGATLACTDCHEDGAGMNRLRLLNGALLEFDHAYKLCAQCHFQQARAWAGGGHGKRLMGWAGPRVVRNCTGCHNPHEPLLPVGKPRWPAIVPNAPAKTEAGKQAH